MRSPVIEVRQHNLCVFPAFHGVLHENSIETRHNFRGNHILHVVDSNGAHWATHFARTDYHGLRRAFSAAIWNISTDYYSFTSSPTITVAEFRGIIGESSRFENPDDSDLAASLLAPLANCPASDLLVDHIASLNL